MGHGKETPRQKMIGMMYLMLTAMLALNVSAEVLDAFRIVDEGLKKTTENFYEKNKVLYKEFDKKYALNEKKVGPHKDKADEVRERADELYNYIQDLKLEIVKTSQGQNEEENAAIEDGKIKNEKLKALDKTDVPSRVLIGDNYNGKGYELKEKIKNYRDFLLGLIDEEDTRVIHSIESSLETKDPDAADSEHGEALTWEVKHFYNIPMGAIMPILSKFQSDVRNTESEVVQYLFNQIEAGSFSFNKLEATVIPNSSYIIKDNEYKADVFLAAVDTTAPPIVLIGEIDSFQNEDGSWEYMMKEGTSYDSLDVVNGRGKYSRIGRSTGTEHWGGLIKLRGPDGNYITKKFERSYTIAEPNVVVSPTKMNVFYVGVDNPVSISVAGVAGKDIAPSITNGQIRKQRDGEYIVNPRRPGNSIITVVAEIDGERKSMGNQQFRVKSLPDPVAQVANKSGGQIEKNTLAAQGGIFAEMENFDFDLEFEITEFTVSTTDRGGYYIGKKAKGNAFTREQLDLINDLRRNQQVIFEDIKAIGPDGSVRNLDPIVFKII